MELEALVEASRTGDKQAFGRIVAAYQGLVCSVTYSLTGDLQKSEDIAQETFLAAWQRLRDLRDPRKLPAWLCGIARNLARSAFRRDQRDPLSGSVALDDRHVIEAQVEPSSMAESDRLALVWQTLADIPEEYREPLVLFYREGHSVRDVAAALELTEDCVKQRLSRGRAMVKAQVARLVEDTLEQTRPGEAFTAGVMAVLPLMAAPASVTATLTGGGSVAGKAIAGAKLASLLGGAAGILLGVTGGFFGMWAGIRNSPTLRTRRATLVGCTIAYALIWVFLAYQALCGILFWRNVPFMCALCGIGWMVYVPLVVALIYFSGRWGMRIARQDAGLMPSPATPLERSGLARNRLWAIFAGAFLLAVLSSAVVVFWIYSMPWTHAGWPVILGTAILVHCAYAALFRKGMRMAHDEEAFLNAPPKLSLDEFLSGSQATDVPGKRSGFVNDLAALGGVIFGPMAPAFGISIASGRYLFAGLMYVLCMAALVFGLGMRRTPRGRQWGYIIVCAYMGVVCGLCTAANGTYQFFPGQLPEIDGRIFGLIPLALYWGIGLALFLILRLQSAPQQKDREQR